MPHNLILDLGDKPAYLSMEDWVRQIEHQPLPVASPELVAALAGPAPTPAPALDPAQYLEGVYPHLHTLNGMVLVYVEKAYKDEITLAGQQLYFDPSFDRLRHVVESGCVVAVPRTQAEYHDVPMEARVGDTVYFHYHSICDSSRVRLGEQDFYLVEYERLYCAIRGGAVAMLNDFCLVRPVFTADGVARTESGIIIQADERDRPSARRGTLVYAHPVRKGQQSLPPIGSDVAFLTNADLPLTVQGEEFFVMDGQREIIGSFCNFAVAV